ncbi:MAG: LysM peptidoglycan-binding domain-containing protein [Thermodesulfobacteriota bacterium]
MSKRKWYQYPISWKKTFTANRDKIDDPKNLQIGTVLVIP